MGQRYCASLAALALLREKQFVHADIKPDNILVNEAKTSSICFVYVFTAFSGSHQDAINKGLDALANEVRPCPTASSRE